MAPYFARCFSKVNKTIQKIVQLIVFYHLVYYMTIFGQLKEQILTFPVKQWAYCSKCPFSGSGWGACGFDDRYVVTKGWSNFFTCSLRLEVREPCQMNFGISLFFQFLSNWRLPLKLLEYFEISKVDWFDWDIYDDDLDIQKLASGSLFSPILSIISGRNMHFSSS